MGLNTTALVRLRLRRGWSQAKLARQAGINQSWYCQLEHGRGNPSERTIRKIADAFGVTVDEVTA